MFYFGTPVVICCGTVFLNVLHFTGWFLTTAIKRKYNLSRSTVNEYVLKRNRLTETVEGTDETSVSTI